MHDHTSPTLVGHSRPELASSSTLVAEEQFILATRDTGYRDVAAALAELVDNALQAGARHVHVHVREEAGDGIAHLPGGSGHVHRDGGDRRREIILGVLDDGRGMTAQTLRTALRFGGTERFGDRSGLGRFGMGLPNSSVSQSRRLEVYSWQPGADVTYSYLDVDDVAAGRQRMIPEPRPAPLPAWLGDGPPSPSGTLVLWTRCDRVARYRASTIERRLHPVLGRLYRYALWAGVRLTVNGTPVEPVDPLFLDPRSGVHGAVPYGPPMRFELATSDDRSSVVEVRFSELPVRAWAAWGTEEKRRSGIVGGAGVSVVRAGREIDYGWFLMGTKRRENYDDWWRCEIRFAPDLDEWFGVTHSKQGITPSPALRLALADDLGAVARALNARVRSAFEEVKALRDGSHSPAALVAAAPDRYLPPFQAGTATVGDLRYRLRHAALQSPEYYAVQLRRNVVIVTLNAEHPFYTRVYAPACQAGRERERYHLECLIFAAARADLAVAGVADGETGRRRRAWSDALAAFVDA